MGRHVEDLKYFLSKDAPAETRKSYRIMVGSWIFTVLLTVFAVVVAVAKLIPEPLCYIPLIPALICVVMSIIFLLMAMKD